MKMPIVTRPVSRHGLFTAALGLAAAAIAAVFLSGQAAVAQPCTGPGAPTSTDTQCLTAISIPGNPLRSFDISWSNPDRGQYYFSDRSNSGVDVIDTHSNTFQRTLGGFVGVVLNGSGGVDNDHSGPDGVTSHDRWLYAGDGNSTLKVFDLDAPTASALKQSIPTGGTTRVDEMALTPDGNLLLAANNAEDPPFATLFSANGDANQSMVSIITKVTVDPSIIPAGFGLSLEQSTWEPKTRRFYVSVPVINQGAGGTNTEPGCNYGQNSGPITCDGGMLVIDPTTLSKPTAVIGAFDQTTNTGVVPLHACGPNGVTVGPHSNLLMGCTPGNNPSDATTLVINARTKNYANIANITGSDEVWFNKGDHRYYTGSSANGEQNGGTASPVLGVIDGTSVLIETVPQGSASHSVAADCKLNHIFLPEAAPKSVVGTGGDTTGVSAGICGGTNGCVAVYVDTKAQNHHHEFGWDDEHPSCGRHADHDLAFK
jgi:hypothetical protein